LKSQIVTSSWGGTRKLPLAFAEGGVAMLSGLLRIVTRLFKAIKERIKALEQADNYNLTAINDLSEDTQRSLDDIYIAISELAGKQKIINKPHRPVGYIQPKEDK
jgi:hypothetical protein